MPSGTPTEMFVDGKWTGGSAGSFTVYNPSTGAEITSVPRAGDDDVAAAVSAAASALPDWAATAPRERSEVLRRTFELMIERKEDLAFLMSLEMGKSLTDARGEVVYAAEFFRWFAEEAVRIGGELRTAPSGANRILTFRKPVGVALLLTPWNFPAAMATRKIGPALAAGCTVILKPAGETPLTALMLGSLLAEAGAPAGVVNVLTTDKAAELVVGRAVGRARAQAVVHRLDRCRQPAAQAGRGPDRELLDGARRQRAVHRARRRRSRRRGRGRDARQDAQRWSGLHGGEPLPRAVVGRVEISRRRWPRRWARW